MGKAAGILLILLIIAVYLTRNYKKDLFDKKEYCYSFACFLLEQCHFKKLFSKEQEQSFASLYPGKDIKTAVLKYQCKRISYGIYGMFLVLLFILLFSIAGSSEAENEGEIVRPLYGEGTKDVSLDITLESGDEEEVVRKNLELDVEEKEYSSQEWENLRKEITDYLDKTVIGENPSADEIRNPLNLPETYPGTSVEINWTTDSNYIDLDGSIKNTWDNENEIPEDGVITELKAAISCSGFEDEYYIYLKIYPQEYSTAEKAWHTLEEYIFGQEEKTRKADSFELPKTIGSYQVVLNEKKDYTLVYICILGGIFIIILTMLPARDIREEKKKRERQLLLDYPKMLHKFVLLLGAGLTVRKIFERLTADYQKEKEKGGEIRYVYEEMDAMVRMIQNGGSEAVAIEQFGRKIRFAQYLRFTSLLLQNQKKGSKDLLLLLENESVNAMERNREMVRIMGEEAGTKLILPMGIMLCIVFLVIIVPAFMTF
jgi:hypothetical protein